MTMYGSLMWLHNRHVTDAYRHMIHQARQWITPCREDDYKSKKKKKEKKKQDHQLMKGTNPNQPACTLDNDLEFGLDLATYQLSTRAKENKIGQVKLNESSHAVKLVYNMS